MDLQKFRKAFMGVSTFAMKNLLYSFRAEYFGEKNRKRKREMKAVYQQAEKDLHKIISVLSVMEKIPVDKIYLTDENGRMYDCSNPDPRDVEGNELADLLIDFSKGL